MPSASSQNHWSDRALVGPVTLLVEPVLAVTDPLYPAK